MDQAPELHGTFDSYFKKELYILLYDSGVLAAAIVRGAQY
jgi:hypothetical protein